MLYTANGNTSYRYITFQQCKLTVFAVFRATFIFQYQIAGPLIVERRSKNFVESRVSLVIVEPLHQLIQFDVLRSLASTTVKISLNIELHMKREEESNHAYSTEMCEHVILKA